MKICVTGGYGFIGGELVKSLNNLGFKDIVILDKTQNDFNFLKEIDFIFHLETFDYQFSTKLIIECNLRKIYVVFASSVSVYGSDSRKGINPLNEYGKTKLLIEKFVSYFPHDNVVCLRYHNVYGANDNNSIIYKAISDYKNGIKEITLFDDSENILADFETLELVSTHSFGMTPIIQ